MSDLSDKFAMAGRPPAQKPLEVPLDFRLRLSPSKMIVFKQCKKAFEHAILKGQSGGDNIHSAVGTACHSIVERINKGQVLDVKEREELLHQLLMAECIKGQVDVEFTKGYKESRETILKYTPPEGRVLLSTEQKHVLNMGSYDFVYIIDSEWTDPEGEELDIVDYKTSAACPGPFQIELYGWAEWKRLDADPDKMNGYYHMLRKNERVHVPLSRARLEQIDEYMKASVALMLAMFKQNAEFPATPGNCFFCQVQGCTARK